jgi:hypothetical protein
MECSTVIIEAFIVCIYLRSLFEFSTEIKYRAAAYFVYFLATSALNIFVSNPIVLILFTLVAVMVLAYFLYDGTLVWKFFAALLFCVFMVVSEILCGGVIALLKNIEFGNTKDYFDDWMLGIFISKFIQIIIVKIVGTYALHRKTKTQVKIIWVIPLIVAQIMLILLTYYLFVTSYISSNRALSPSVLIITVGISFVSIIIFWYFDTLSAMSEYRQENLAKDIQLEQQIKYYDLLVQRQEEIDSHWHDIRKHVEIIRRLTGTMNNETAQEYTVDLQKSLTNTMRIVRLSDPTVTAVLNYGIERCKKVGIQIIHDIRMPGKIKIKPKDLCIVLGNIFDNAIEACEMLSCEKNKRIELNIYHLNGSILIEITNTFNPDTKESKPNAHGIGLKNVKRVVEQYHGDIKQSSEEGQFRVSIIIP